MNSVLVIMPAYNEGENIVQVIEAIQMLREPFDLLVINDGSEDRTVEQVKARGVSVVSLPYNSGYGVACQTGFKYAVEMNYKYVLQMDSDGQHRPEDLIKLLEPLMREEADIVIGSRFISHNSYAIGFLKKIAIGFFCKIIKGITGAEITDPSSGLQGLSRKTFKFYAQMDNYPMDYPDADVLIRMILLGFRVKEIPATFHNRAHGKSMHSGIKPVYYMLKVCMSVLLVVLREKLSKGDSK